MLRKAGAILLLFLAFSALVLTAWYQIDGQPLPQAAQYLRGDDYTAVLEEDGGLVFTPAVANGHGLLIMHGALIKPLSYAKTAAYFAARGYTVYLPSGAARLSIAAVDAAAARMQEFNVQDWVMLGHSMGGFSSLELIARHGPRVRALALWACAMPADHSDVELPILFIHGDRDGLLTPERLATARARLPASAEYLALPGGNHQGFAMYSHQFFDGEPAISRDEQIDFANGKTAAFFARVLQEPSPGPL